MLLVIGRLMIAHLFFGPGVGDGISRTKKISGSFRGGGGQ